MEVTTAKRWIDHEIVTYQADGLLKVETDSLSKVANKMTLEGNAQLRSSYNELIIADEITIFIE